MDTLAAVTMQTPSLGFDPRPVLIVIVLLGSASLVAVLVLTDESPCWQTEDNPGDNSSAKGEVRVAQFPTPRLNRRIDVTSVR